MKEETFSLDLDEFRSEPRPSMLNEYVVRSNFVMADLDRAKIHRGASHPPRNSIARVMRRHETFRHADRFVEHSE